MATTAEHLAPPPGVDLVWYGRVAELAEEALSHRHLLDAEESSRLDAFLRPKDRHAYAVAHVALRRLLGMHLGIAPAAVAMERRPCSRCGGPHGRPAVPEDRVHFSLSHTSRTTDGRVLIALARTAVGVDVEVVPGEQTVAEVSRQLHPHERTELDALHPADRPLAFARCWTRKESVLKATGAGLGEGVSGIHVGAGPVPQQRPMGAELPCALTDLPAGPGYAAAVAVLGTPARTPGPSPDLDGD
ncbi:MULTISPECIES: 4'-phosphopantetheinyl transferase family protein [Streptomyces]|uniref:Phosphopantetheinyl transferase FKPPT1 n=2 Tax=Streptomyces tsukubensis TaxID=83656 RepID=A0A0Y0SAB4_9ACTN|nr:MULTISPECIES: 4'-phosphopantetheinyl transferase superfamily protein [Streptomyces]AMB72338.1 phosphopantetheinyl transferase FKPPT1 [Streptomyces tsukubensis]AZK95517.1 4-phosphopantetheinyl transferase [Streptomyces tsukubensis]EIF91443.1 4'-phosphopantetheinyl transferase [Streptomyces tsukubensis NRRL18488]MYS66692.1 4'-phosphopantetheinyl transferase superfamily protein [Streptomyces sp. SID5473]QKM68441.1 4-phosphopantetheinyl transferase [Streptomyces tsukubensis NRRL18488]